jgi:hypothetical protein
MTIRSGEPPPQAKPAAAAGGGFKRALILLGVVAAAVGIAYGAGRMQTASRIAAAEQQASKAQQASETLEARVLRLEARRRLHLALIQLEERNFGSAEQHLKAAAVLLERSKPEGELEKLRALLAQARLKAGDDIAAQRAWIVSWATHLDTLMPPANP